MPAHAQNHDWPSKFDPIIETGIASGTIPGAAIVVVKNGAITFAKGYGNSTVSGQNVDEHTRFSLASVSKSFVGLALVKLVQADQLDFDADISFYLPHITPTALADDQTLRVRHLLNHTSGYSTYAGNINQSDRQMDLKNLRRQATTLGEHTLSYVPGFSVRILQCKLSNSRRLD